MTKHPEVQYLAKTFPGLSDPDLIVENLKRRIRLLKKAVGYSNEPEYNVETLPQGPSFEEIQKLKNAKQTNDDMERALEKALNEF
tara:strand:- start:104 stop:358 length:255 start_codon:yes stop_codon:yes gene_type:complete